MTSLSLFMLLQKRVYPYEYMDDWEKFNETSLPEKEDFYIYVNMVADYTHEKRFWKDFKWKKVNIMIYVLKAVYSC